MLAISSLAVLSLPAGKDYTSRFHAYKSKYAKSYDSAAHETAAFAAFSNNDDIIETHNARRLSYTLAHNEYSDLSPHDFFNSRLGYGGQRLVGTVNRPVHTFNASVTVPSSVDWVAKGGVTSVKQQGQCGSCWSFSTAGAVEGAYFVATGSLISLSEEDLVQCDTTDNGCNGGLMDNAFAWVEQHGIATEAAYPYTSTTSSGTRGTCEITKEKAPAVTITGFSDVAAGDEDALRTAVAQQPVSIAIEADKSAFQLYSSGVLDNSACGTNLDHGVLLVGYGTDVALGKDYWKVKNSWGSSWGEDGFIRMVRGKNQCGVASRASYPTGAKTASGGGGGSTYSYNGGGEKTVEDVTVD